MSLSTDKRAVKTRKKLFDAYLQLLKTTAPHDITIQQLTKHANINRVTFYKHFQHIANFHELFTLHYFEELYGFMKSLNYKTYVKGFELEALVALFTHIEQQQDVYKVLFTSPNLQQFNQQLLDFFQQKIKKHTEELAMFDFPGTGVQQEIVAWYGMSALLGTIHMWIQSDFRYPPTMLATSFVKLSPHPN